MSDINITFIKSIFKKLRETIKDKETELLEMLEESQDCLNTEIQQLETEEEDA